MSTPSRQPGDDDGDDQHGNGEPTHAHGADPETRRREEEAVDAATSERLSQGVRRDMHGEYAPDPYPDDPDETSEDVIEQHREQAERVEHQPDVPRADE